MQYFLLIYSIHFCSHIVWLHSVCLKLYRPVQDALKAVAQVEVTLGCQPLGPGQMTRFRQVQIPIGSKLVYEADNIVHDTSCIEVYLQVSSLNRSVSSLVASGSLARKVFSYYLYSEHLMWNSCPCTMYHVHSSMSRVCVNCAPLVCVLTCSECTVCVGQV